MPLGEKGEIWRGCEKSRGCLRGLGGPTRAGGPHSVKKRDPECTRRVLRRLHCQEMALSKKGEIWRGCEETRGCLRGLGAQKRAGGPHSVEKRGPERTRGVLRGLHCQEMPLRKKGEIWRCCEETRGCLRGLGTRRELGSGLCGKEHPSSALWTPLFHRIGPPSTLLGPQTPYTPSSLFATPPDFSLLPQSHFWTM